MFNLLEKLNEKTEYFELENPPVPLNKANVGAALEMLFGTGIPLDVQDWMLDQIMLQKLTIDRRVDPVFVDLDITIGETPPVLNVFPNILIPQSTAFSVKTNQPPVEPGQSGKITAWSFSVTVVFLGNDVTIKTDHTSPKRFELTGFTLEDAKFDQAFQDLGIHLPEVLFEAIPSKNVIINHLVVDDSGEETQFEFDITTQFRSLFGGLIDPFLLTKPTLARLYYKTEAKDN